jgi:hypothetical protein
MLFSRCTGRSLLGAEGRAAADHVAGVAQRVLGLAGADLLDADLAREFLGRHLAVAVHQDDQRACRLVFHDQGLDHRVFRDVEFACRHTGAAMLLVLVEVVGMGDAMLVQELGRRGFGG